MIRQLPRKSIWQRLPGIFAVILLHCVIGYFLFNGLTRKTETDIVEQPLVVSLIEAPKPAPAAVPLPPEPVKQPEPVPVPAEPAPPVPKPEPPKPKPKPKPRPKPVEAPRPAPVEPAPAPPVPQVEPRASVAAAPSAPAAPHMASITVVCSNHASVRGSVPYPNMARRRNVEGKVIAEFTVTTYGQIQDAQIVSSSNTLFDEAVLEAVQRFKCNGQTVPVRIRVPFEFSLR